MKAQCEPWAMFWTSYKLCQTKTYVLYIFISKGKCTMMNNGSAIWFLLTFCMFIMCTVSCGCWQLLTVSKYLLVDTSVERYILFFTDIFLCRFDCNFFREWGQQTQACCSWFIFPLWNLWPKRFNTPLWKHISAFPKNFLTH